MNAGQLLLVVQALVGLLLAEGLLRADGTFDTSKLDTVQEDIAFGAKVEAVLEQHGLNVPDRVNKIIAVLPLVASLIG